MSDKLVADRALTAARQDAAAPPPPPPTTGSQPTSPGRTAASPTSPAADPGTPSPIMTRDHVGEGWFAWLPSGGAPAWGRTREEALAALAAHRRQEEER